MALLLVAVVAGCGGGDGIPVPGTTTPGAGPGAGSGGHGPTPVDLLSVGTNNFVILATSQITDANLGSITGNIGLSPAAGSNVFVSCAEMVVPGKIYEVDATYAVTGFASCAMPGTAGTGANKTLVDNAVGDMGTAYTAAAGKTLPDRTELGTGNISGMTLAPGLYKWSNSVLINSNVTLSGGANDVWIFQIAGDLSIASCASCSSATDAAGIKVVLSGAAQASNVFWQVGGGTGATLGTYSTFNGNILSAKQVVIQHGAVLHGRALAGTQVTLDANTVGP
jgi:hypothetical protein